MPAAADWYYYEKTLSRNFTVESFFLLPRYAIFTQKPNNTCIYGMHHFDWPLRKMMQMSLSWLILQAR